MCRIGSRVGGMSAMACLMIASAWLSSVPGADAPGRRLSDFGFPENADGVRRCLRLFSPDASVLNHVKENLALLKSASFREREKATEINHIKVRV